MKQLGQILPWVLVGVLLVLLLKPTNATTAQPGQESEASASCVGLLNIGACNVHAEAQQQPAQPEKRSNTASILAVIMVGAVALVVGGLLAEERLYAQLGGAR